MSEDRFNWNPNTLELEIDIDGNMSVEQMNTVFAGLERIMVVGAVLNSPETDLSQIGKVIADAYGKIETALAEKQAKVNEPKDTPEPVNAVPVDDRATVSDINTAFHSLVSGNINRIEIVTANGNENIVVFTKTGSGLIASKFAGDKTPKTRKLKTVIDDQDTKLAVAGGVIKVS